MQAWFKYGPCKFEFELPESWQLRRENLDFYADGGVFSIIQERRWINLIVGSLPSDERDPDRRRAKLEQFTRSEGMRVKDCQVRQDIYLAGSNNTVFITNEHLGRAVCKLSCIVGAIEFDFTFSDDLESHKTLRQIVSSFRIVEGQDLINNIKDFENFVLLPDLVSGKPSGVKKGWMGLKNALGHLLTQPQHPKSKALQEEKKVFVDKHLRDQPAEVRRLCERANQLARIGDFKGALAAFSQAVKLDPSVPTTYYDMGNFFRDQSKLDEAISAYSKCIDLDPQFAWAYCNRGVTYFDKRMYREALQDFKQAVKLNPKDGMSYVNMGRAYWKLGQREESEEAFKAAIRADPSMTALVNRARSELR